MENMTMNPVTNWQSVLPVGCAASALRTDVRGTVVPGDFAADGTAALRDAAAMHDARFVAIVRDRAITTGKGQIGFDTAVVPGSLAWSPPL